MDLFIFSTVFAALALFGLALILRHRARARKRREKERQKRFTDVPSITLGRPDHPAIEACRAEMEASKQRYEHARLEEAWRREGQVELTKRRAR